MGENTDKYIKNRRNRARGQPFPPGVAAKSGTVSCLFGSMRTPPGTLRVIGAVVVAGGRAVDLALVESDGREIVRRLEFQRVQLEGDAHAVSAAIQRFMGDVGLQPSAIDVVAVAHDADAAALGDLRVRMGIETVTIDPGAQWPRSPLAERIALVAAQAAV